MQRSSDGWTVIVGLLLIAAVGLGWVGQVPCPLPWEADLRAALPLNHAVKLLSLLVGIAALATLGVRSTSGPHDARFWGIDRGALSFLATSAAVGVIAIGARVLNHQSLISALALPDACIALGLAVGVSHALPTVTRRRSIAFDVWLRLGLTLLGAEVLMPHVLALGVVGLVLVGIVTPVAIVTVWLVGTRLLNVSASPRLLLLAVAGAIGGVSALMAASTASRARKNEIGFALLAGGVSTALLIHLLPLCARTLQLDAYVSGAWFGGTLDVFDAARAANVLGDATTVKVASTVARIQGGMLGLIALVLSVYWITSVPRSAKPSDVSQRFAGLWGFPSAVVGLLVASAVSSFVLSPLLGHDAMQELAHGTGELRAWCFALGAAALGMEVSAGGLMLEADRGKSVALLALGVVIDVALTLMLASQVLGPALTVLPR